MSDDLRDLEMDSQPPLLEPPPRRTGWRWVALAALLALLGAGAYYVLRPRAEAPPATTGEPLSAPAAGELAEAQSEGEEPPLVLPPLAESDDLVRRLVAALSAHPQLAAWLAHDELVRRLVVSVDNLAEGKTPRVHVPFLAPSGGFRVDSREGGVVVDAASYRRYDRLAEVFVSLDSAGAGRLYRKLEPLLDQAYRELGYPDADFDDALARAIGRLLAVPVVEGEVALAPQVVSFELADPRLEGLSPAAKQLLRMGPENTRRIQAKLRELARALGITPR